MKKLLYLLVALLVIYFGIEISFINFNKGHNLEYKINKDKKTFKIKEIYTKKTKNEIDNYYFEIKVDDITFNYQTYTNYKKNNYLIKDIEYYEDDEYKCIFLKTKDNKPISDLICKNNDIQMYYNSIKGKNQKLDKYVSKLKYYKENKDSIKNKIDADPITLYQDNLLDNHYLYVQNYKGLYLVNKKDKIKNINLFKDDVYSNYNSIINKKYYITANYNEKYKFHEFYLVNIINAKKDKIISNEKISLDSYIQGSIDDEVYLFDKSDKKQYRINLKNKIVTLSGNTSRGINLYENGSYLVGSAYDAAKENIYFNQYKLKNEFNKKEYSRVDKVGNKKSGYYYLYLKKDKYYEVYRVNIQNNKILTYLFNTDDINNIYYYNDYIYFKDANYIKYYNDTKGIKTLIKNKEFEFNESIKFGLYIEK